MNGLDGPSKHAPKRNALMHSHLLVAVTVSLRDVLVCCCLECNHYEGRLSSLVQRKHGIVAGLTF